VGRRRSPVERLPAAQQPLLQLALASVQQGDGEAALVAEPAVEGALADAGPSGDGIHRDRAHAELGEQLLGGGEHTLAVPCGIRALSPPPGTGRHEVDG
jgi:hypothetical protein